MKPPKNLQNPQNKSRHKNVKQNIQTSNTKFPDSQPVSCCFEPSQLLGSKESPRYEGCSFVMSAVLPFVNYISHAVKTCIRRNFKSYPVTLNKIVLPPLSMWLFDVLKNVVSSTVPEKKEKKKGSQRWAKPTKPRSS